MHVKTKQTILLIASLCSLVFGICIYLTQRQDYSARFIPDSILFDLRIFDFLGNTTQFLPSLLHVYAFILLSFVFLKPSKLGTMYIYIAWLFTDLVFEFIQHPYFISLFDISSTSSITNNAVRYMSAGTFDFKDVFAIILGVIIAHLTITIIHGGVSCKTQINTNR